MFDPDYMGSISIASLVNVGAADKGVYEHCELYCTWPCHDLNMRVNEIPYYVQIANYVIFC